MSCWFTTDWHDKLQKVTPPHTMVNWLSLTATAGNRLALAGRVGLGLVLGNLCVLEWALFRDYAPIRPGPLGLHMAAAVIGLLLGGLAGNQGSGLIHGVILCLGIASGVVWAAGLTAAAYTGSGHLVDFVLWSAFAQTATTALIDGPLLFVAAVLAASRLPPILP